MLNTTMKKEIKNLKDLDSILDAIYKQNKEINIGFGDQDLYIFTSTEQVLVFKTNSDSIHISFSRYEKKIKDTLLIEEGYEVPLEYYAIEEGNIEIPYYNTSENSKEELLEVLYRQLEPSSELSNQILLEYLV